MKLNNYLEFWRVAEPLFRQKLVELKESLRPKVPFVLTEISQHGDEDFCLSFDLEHEGQCVLGIDFRLLDSAVHGGDAGVGVMLEFIGHGGLALGSYAPYNYTADAFTSEVEELQRRIDALDVAEAANYLLKEALMATWALA